MSLLDLRNYPGPQTVHDALPTSLNVPVTQSTHELVPPVENLPTAHDSQELSTLGEDVSLLGLIFPAPHAVQSVLAGP